MPPRAKETWSRVKELLDSLARALNGEISVDKTSATSDSDSETASRQPQPLAAEGGCENARRKRGRKNADRRRRDDDDDDDVPSIVAEVELELALAAAAARHELGGGSDSEARRGNNATTTTTSDDKKKKKKSTQQIGGGGKLRLASKEMKRQRAKEAPSAAQQVRLLSNKGEGKSMSFEAQITDVRNALFGFVGSGGGNEDSRNHRDAKVRSEQLFAHIQGWVREFAEKTFLIPLQLYLRDHQSDKSSGTEILDLWTDFEKKWRTICYVVVYRLSASETRSSVCEMLERTKAHGLEFLQLRVADFAFAAIESIASTCDASQTEIAAERKLCESLIRLMASVPHGSNHEDRFNGIQRHIHMIFRLFSSNVDAQTISRVPIGFVDIANGDESDEVIRTSMERLHMCLRLEQRLFEWLTDEKKSDADTMKGTLKAKRSQVLSRLLESMLLRKSCETKGDVEGNDREIGCCSFPEEAAPFSGAFVSWLAEWRVPLMRQALEKTVFPFAHDIFIEEEKSENEDEGGHEEEKIKGKLPGDKGRGVADWCSPLLHTFGSVLLKQLFQDLLTALKGLFCCFESASASYDPPPSVKELTGTFTEIVLGIYNKYEQFFCQFESLRNSNAQQVAAQWSRRMRVFFHKGVSLFVEVGHLVSSPSLLSKAPQVAWTIGNCAVLSPLAVFPCTISVFLRSRRLLNTSFRSKSEMQEEPLVILDETVRENAAKYVFGFGDGTTNFITEMWRSLSSACASRCNVLLKALCAMEGGSGGSGGVQELGSLRFPYHWWEADVVRGVSMPSLSIARKIEEELGNEVQFASYLPDKDEFLQCSLSMARQRLILGAIATSMNFPLWQLHDAENPIKISVMIAKCVEKLQQDPAVASVTVFAELLRKHFSVTYGQVVVSACGGMISDILKSVKHTVVFFDQQQRDKAKFDAMLRFADPEALRGKKERPHFTVLVLSPSHWPTLIASPLIWSNELLTTAGLPLAAFTCGYLKNRVLRWVPSAGAAVLAVNFAKTTKEVVTRSVLLGLMLVALDQFSGGVATMQDLMAKLYVGVPEAALLRLLCELIPVSNLFHQEKAISGPIAKAVPLFDVNFSAQTLNYSQESAGSISVRLRGEFACKMRKIVLPLPFSFTAAKAFFDRNGAPKSGAKHEEGEEEAQVRQRGIEVKRETILDIIIVRMMKSRKIMKASEVFEAVVEQLQNTSSCSVALGGAFVPSATGLKRAVESLMNRGYLERLDDEKIGYVA